MTTNRRCKRVLSETNLKMSLSFFTLTAMKLTAWRNLMNFDADECDSLCSDEFTLDFKRAMINNLDQVELLSKKSVIFNLFGWVLLIFVESKGVSLLTLLEVLLKHF